MRKHYIDNLRIFCILLLIPFHTTMIYNTFGEIFYVNGTPNESLSFVNIGVYAWWMTGLFVLAGMSTMYAFSFRTGRQYVKERFFKLFIPLISCLVFVVPLQTYISDRFHNGYEGNYFEHLKIYLTITDFGGYDGHFTPGHAWFMLYLFIISLVTLPILIWYKKKEKKIDGSRLTMPILLLLGLPVVLSGDILNVGGKSFAQFGACFLIGYFFLSNEEVLERLKKWSIPLGIVWLGLIIARCANHAIGDSPEWVDCCIYHCLTWIGILAMLGLGKRFLDHDWKFTRHFVKAEFPIYIFHQTVVIVVGYLMIPKVESVYMQYFLINVLSFGITYLLYMICRRFKLTRFLFAIRR